MITITAEMLRNRGACHTSSNIVRHLLPFRLSTSPEENIKIAISLAEAYRVRYWSEGTSQLCDDIFWMIDGLSSNTAMEMCNFENHVATNGGTSGDILCVAQYLAMLAEVL